MNKNILETTSMILLGIQMSKVTTRRNYVVYAELKENKVKMFTYGEAKQCGILRPIPADLIREFGIVTMFFTNKKDAVNCVNTLKKELN